MTNNPIVSAEAELKTNPLRAVDYALHAIGLTKGHRSTSQTEHYLEVLARAILNANSCSLANEEDPVESMLSSPACDQLACAALMRLLVLDEDVFTEDQRLRSSTSLFDRTVGARLYSGLDISTKTQPFEKRAALRQSVAEHEHELIGHVDSLGSLSALAPFRQQLSKLFKDPYTQLVVWPFIPGITLHTFTEVLTAVQAVAESNDASLPANAEQATDLCTELRTQADSIGTTYAQSVLGTLGATLATLVRGEVRERGLADPAELTVSMKPKRFPLQQKGSRVLIRLEVTNHGPGQAKDVFVSVEDHQQINFEQRERSVGILPACTRIIGFVGTVLAPSDGEVVLVQYSWRNSDGEQRTEEQVLELSSQEGSVDWQALEYEDPYPLEAVTDLDAFVGRDALLTDLTKGVLASTPGNARIQGQRRVGKTSIANALEERVERLRPGAYRFIYLESGDYSQSTTKDTVRRLGELLADGVRQSDPRLGSLAMPDFDGGISPLTEFFAQSGRIAPELKFVIVLDEFDAMPHGEIYDHGPVGTAFFQTLRSLGSKSNLCFILVGGERMRYIIAVHGQALNKFRLIPVDYFDDEHYQDYLQLVREPVQGILEFDDRAIQVLHQQTAGNPWLTKSIARRLFDRQRSARDSHVTADDMQEVIEAAIPSLGAESFQHFWDDAISGDADEQRQVAGIRRRVLLAIASRLRNRQPLSAESIASASRPFDVDGPSALDAVRGFTEREILLAKPDGTLEFRVPLFGRWLVEEGVREIVVTMGDDDAILRRQRAIEDARPKPAELTALSERWRTYGGRLITDDQIKAWLQQFGEPLRQRSMLQVLQALKFYNAELIRVRLQELHDAVVRDLVKNGHEYTKTGQQRLRDDLVVCGLEGGGSGAGHLVKPYRDENGIYADLAVDSSKIGSIATDPNRTIRAIVVLEDFVGTGKTASTRLKELDQQWGDEIDWSTNEISVYFLAVCAFEGGMNRVRRSARSLAMPIKFEVADELTEEHKCFHENSKVFPDEGQRERARAAAYEIGVELERKHPLGYMDSQALICFEARCPNNTLPILWKRASDWAPLFPRHT
jgi:hypothetical protein